MNDKLSIQQCRKLIPENSHYSDQQILKVRNLFYQMAEGLLNIYDKVKLFLTRSRTIDAKARIVK